MTIKELKEIACTQALLTTPLTYLVFGGQGSVYISKLEYCPAKHQVKLISEHKDTYKGPARFEDILIFPDTTEILIEGYPGDDKNPEEWVTPNEVEILNSCIDFARIPEGDED